MGGRYDLTNFEWSVIALLLPQKSRAVKRLDDRRVLSAILWQKSFGGLMAVADLSMTVPRRCVAGLMGPNGASKSTTLRAISGLHRPVMGSITGRCRGDRRVAGASGGPPRPRPRAGGPHGGCAAFGRGEPAAVPLCPPRRGARAYDTGVRPAPAPRRAAHQIAGLLSGGEQQMLAIGRAMMTSPRVLLLDERSMGLAPAIVDQVFGAIVTLYQQGQSILLVERNAEIALEISDFAYVLRRGSIVAEATGAALRADTNLLETYLS